jgi:hypothetical protein
MQLDAYKQKGGPLLGPPFQFPTCKLGLPPRVPTDSPHILSKQQNVRFIYVRKVCLKIRTLPEIHSQGFPYRSCAKRFNANGSASASDS